jgi:hypothetical protein
VKRAVVFAGLAFGIFGAGTVTGSVLVFTHGEKIATPIIEAATWLANASHGPAFTVEIESTLQAETVPASSTTTTTLPKTAAKQPAKPARKGK